MKHLSNLTFVPVVMAAIVAVPAAAQDGAQEGPYIGLSGGVSLPSDSSNSGTFDAGVPETDDFGSIPEGTDLALETDFDTGYTISGQAGYAFNNGFRVEVEAAYSEYDVDSHEGLLVGGANIDGVDSAVLTRGPADAGNPTVGDVLADGQGDVSNFGVYGNVFYDIQTGSGFKPYVGAGVGYQWVDVDYAPSGVEVGDDDDGVFAYQLMAGASYAVTDTVELFGQYTFRDTTEDADIPLTLLPATLGVESQQSLLTAGVRVRFGG
ncbi:outer membrane beta-barrel protein [uncultured Erythrobacter sp.]|uniref:outer membrane protein n=1 Tax=uncultured Erythrobacter sp. TaxID=263913 RepID=UPI002606C43F|nr:outer membrane beta-barrel protein [uncultured Erythrobacter sp.]